VLSPPPCAKDDSRVVLVSNGSSYEPHLMNALSDSSLFWPELILMLKMVILM